MEKILIIDDDEGLVHFLSRFFQRKGYGVAACGSGREAIETLGTGSFDLILLDYKMPGFNGLDTLSEIKKLENKTPVIIMTAYGTTTLAIEAMKRGAYDYLVKPFERSELSRTVSEALLVNHQMKEVVCYPLETPPDEPVANRGGRQIIGHSRKMQRIYKLIGQIAEKDVSVLITGESGTGKELVARAIYHHSGRNEKPFLAINCAAIPESLFESELFGHERGAFTGAERTYIGKLERCDQGTLFLDEIGDMPPVLQAKLLRVLQDGEIERLGGSQTIKLKVRILAATNKDLEAEVKAGRFRKDLYWRLKVISIDLPPLRKRKEDIPDLVNYFLRCLSEEYKRPDCHMSEAAVNKLAAYDWPGNVREIENCVRRAVLLNASNVITEASLELPRAAGDQRRQSRTGDQFLASLKVKLEELIPEILRFSKADIHASIMEVVEDTLIEKALQTCGYNQVKTARLLGISRNTLRHRLKRQLDKQHRDENRAKAAK